MHQSNLFDLVYIYIDLDFANKYYLPLHDYFLYRRPNVIEPLIDIKHNYWEIAAVLIQKEQHCIVYET